MANKYIKDLISTTSPSLTGHTIFDNGVTTYKTTLETLKDTIVDNLSHTFEGNQIINGDLKITGSLTANEYIISSSVTYVTTLAQSGSTRFGDTLNDIHRMTGSLRVTGALNIQGTAIIKESLFVSGFQVIGTPTHHMGADPEVLHVGSINSYNIAHFNGNENQYTQVNIQNVNSGTTASSDLVLTADNGTEDTYYMNVGINSSNYNAGNVGNANDGYIINKGSDLYIGSLSGSTGHNNVHIYTAGNWQNPAISVLDNHSIGFNTEILGPNDKYAFSGNTVFRNQVNVEGSVTASMFIGDGSLLTNLPAGLDGTSGTSGVNGTSGTSGISGTNGSSGTDGSSGTSGSNGTSGTSGTSGISGTDGTSGTSGDSLFAETGSFWATTNDLQVTGSLNVSGSTIIGSGSIHNNNPEILHVENSGSFNVTHLQGNVDTYLQVNIKNLSGAAGASSDYVATADNGSEDLHYVNMGINSSGFDSPFSVGYQNDAYVINRGRDLYIGSLDGPDYNHTHVHLFSSNSWQDPQISIISDKKIGFNTGSVSTGFTYEFSGSLLLDHDLKVKGFVETSHIQGTGSFIIQPDINDSRTIEIYNTSPSDIHIKGNAAYTFLGDDTNYVKIDSSAETIVINAISGTTINNLLKLNPITELPTSSTFGDMVVSGSNLYFHNGSGWNSINMTSI